MITTLSFTSAILVGLLGSLHCLGMCGGIATAIGLQHGKRTTRFIAYHSGRILTYCLLGALLGLSSHTLQEALPQIGPLLRLIAALLLILMGLYVSQWWLGLTFLEKLGGRLWKKMQPIAAQSLRTHNSALMIITGMIWGFLPCGLVYSTLGLALTSGKPAQAALIMLGFGIGTLPLLLISQFSAHTLARKLSHFFKNKMPRTLAGLVLIACGLWTGMGAMMHGEHATHHTHEPKHHHHVPHQP